MLTAEQMGSYNGGEELLAAGNCGQPGISTATRGVMYVDSSRPAIVARSGVVHCTARAAGRVGVDNDIAAVADACKPGASMVA